MFAVTYDRTVIIDEPTSGNWTMELRGLRGDPANPTSGAAFSEDVNGTISLKRTQVLSGLNDIGGHPAAASIMVAVSQRLVDGYSDKSFKPDQTLTRAMMAPYVVSGLGIRQFLPPNGSASFTDVSGSLAPYAEAVSAKGASLLDVFQKTRGVMLPKAAGKFSPSSNVTRADLAYSFVQAMGLEQNALAFTGQVTVQYGDQRIPVDDTSTIPSGLAGYVQLALDLNIMQAYFSLTQGPFDLQPTIHATFKPTKTITRAEYAVHAVRFFSAFLER
jgi:serine protease AprX